MAGIELDLDGRRVRISSPDRVCFPDLGITKAQVVGYFVAVADGLLRDLLDRPTTLERWPRGVFPGARLATMTSPGDAFFQKRLPRDAPDWLRTARLVAPNGSHADLLCPTEPAVLAWAANLGTLTFHAWPVRRPDVDHPDRLHIDLDPQPGTGFREAVEVALELRELLHSYGLDGWVKTSGGRGVHVCVPIEPRWTFDEVRGALIVLSRELVRRLPSLVTTAWSKADRGARVYLDYNQVAGTIASAYSIRPTPQALVSAPLSWDELSSVAPEDFSVLTMPARFAAVGHAGATDRTYALEPLVDQARRDGLDHRRGAPRVERGGPASGWARPGRVAGEGER